MQLTRRSLFRSLAGAFVGSVLARTALLGPRVEPPREPLTFKGVPIVYSDYLPTGMYYEIDWKGVYGHDRLLVLPRDGDPSC